MISKNQISFVKSLQQKKFRKEEGLFIAEGDKIVNELIASSFSVKKIFATESFPDRRLRNNKNSDSEWNEVTDAELKKISALTTPNHVLAIAEIPFVNMDDNEIKNSLSLVLDDVSDPGNLGTIIRLADWFGIKNIICSEETADCYNPKVVQASMGSLFRIKIHYTDLENFFENNKTGGGPDVFGTELQGENIYNSKLSTKGFIVLGNESKGVRNSLKKFFSQTLSIPSFDADDNKPGVDSLNIANAAAIICSEFRRRNE